LSFLLIPSHFRLPHTGKYPGGRGDYQPMSFGGKIGHGEEKKGANEKEKGRKGKENEVKETENEVKGKINA
jgi:hypothetical protein